VILIIFTVKSSEVAYSSSQANVTKGGSDCLCLLWPGGFRIEQSVKNSVGVCVPCNSSLCNLHVTYSVMFVYTMNICIRILDSSLDHVVYVG